MGRTEHPGSLNRPRCRVRGGPSRWLWCLVAVTGIAVGDPRGDWAEALAARDVEALTRLLPAVHDVNVAAPDGRTALMVAAGTADLDLVTALLARGADADARNQRGGSALMYAANAGDPRSVRALLERGAQIDAAARNGWTALMLATARGFDPVVRLLLARGADPDRADIYGTTPLIRAVQQERPSAVRLLLETGRARTDLRDETGGTALHHAAGQGQAEIIDLLIAHGADPGARNRAGRTPSELAMAAGHRAMAERLRQAAAGRPISKGSDSGSIR